MNKLIIILTFTLFTINSIAQTAIEKDMIIEINKLRSNPKSYIPYINKYIESHEFLINLHKKGKLEVRDKNTVEVLKNNISAAREAIRVLNNTKSLDTLTFNKEMYEITKSHAEYLKSVKKISHIGPNNETVVNRFKDTKILVSENIASGLKESFSVNENYVINVIVDLLVDCNVPSRGHRKILLNRKSKFISISINDIVCVQNFGH